MKLQSLVENELPSLDGYRHVSGLIGGERPSTYSVSPKMWNAVFRKFRIPATYIPFDVPIENFEKFIKALREEIRIRGVNVTTPYKKQVIGHLDEVDAHAREYEAVNTVVREGKMLRGFNTDGLGEATALKEALGELAGKKILQIGAGGAGNAISYALVQEGAELVIANRTLEKAADLSGRLQKFFGLASRPAYGNESIVRERAPEVDVILNVSLKGQKSTELEEFSALGKADEGNLENSIGIAEGVPENVLFADIIYNPEETIFLRHGRETGHRTLNGKMMLVYQAVKACEILYLKELSDTGATSEDIAKIMRNEAFS